LGGIQEEWPFDSRTRYVGLGNILGCFYEDDKDANPDFKLMTVATGNDHVRLAVRRAVALATGGVVPTATAFAGPVFEDSTSTDKPVQSNRDIDPWTFLQLS